MQLVPCVLSRSRSVVATLIAMMTTGACTDSSLIGSQRLPDPDVSDPDVSDTDVSGTDASPDTAPDTSDDTKGPRCLSDEECGALADGAGPCEEARCHPTLGLCRLETRPDCCASDNDCPGLGAPCLENICPFPGASCLVVDACAGCETDSDCAAIAPPCALAACERGQCAFAPDPSCCAGDAGCDDGDPCTLDGCADSGCTRTHVCDVERCEPGGQCCAGPVALATSFSPSPAWEGRSSARDLRWRLVRRDDLPSPPAALYFGSADDDFVSADDTVRADVAFELGELTPGATVEVRFRARVDVPERGVVRVFLASPRSRVGLAELPSQSEWRFESFAADVPEPGPWRLVIGYEGPGRPEGAPPPGQLFLLRSGLFLDDLDVRHGCGGAPPVECRRDTDCRVDDPCIDGVCAGGVCEYRPNPLCGAECRGDLDCDDNDPCTTHRCVEGVCRTAGPQGCCADGRSCDDGDPCTADICTDDGRCAHLPVQDPNCLPCEVLCDDGDDCTVDICTPDGQCLNFPSGAPGCGGGGCQVSDDCRDGNPCTEDRCVNGECRNSPRDGCCTSDAMCEDGDPCTRGLCDRATGRCQQLPAPQCGCGDECNDGDPCTTDECAADGTCVNRFEPDLPGCSGRCTDDRACDDGNACTIDRCSGGACLYARVPNCCNSNGQCQDSDRCTIDQCISNRCVNEVVPDCGACDDSRCDDGDPCTLDRCRDDGRCEHVPDPADPVCACRGIDCDDGNPCTRDGCRDGACVNTFDPDLPNCGGPGCQAHSDCDDRNACTVDVCDQSAGCVYIPSANRTPCDDRDACTTNDICLAGNCVGGAARTCDDNDPCTRDACRDGACLHLPDTSLPGCGACSDASCDDGDPCTVDACDANGACVNRFDPTRPGCGEPGCRTNADCEDGNRCTLDACTDEGVCIRVPAEDGNVCEDGDLCTRGDKCIAGRCVAGDALTCDDGNDCTRDFCEGGQCRFERDTSLPGCGGCNITGCDDGDPCTADRCDPATGRCSSSPIAGCCRSGLDCVDGDPCTNDRCDNGECSWTPVSSVECDPDACRSSADCDDGNPCTTDLCDSATGRCTQVPNPSCCTSDNACDDGIPCTLDACDRATGECKNTRTDACCSRDGDCDDRSACTVDVCVATFGICVNANIPCDDGDPCTLDRCDPARGCVFEPDPACACQEEVLWQRHFDGDEGADIDVEGGLLVGWRVDELRAASPARAMRYGNAAGTNYATGFRTAGRATGPSVSLPRDQPVVLSFKVWVDMDTTPDVLAVRIVSDSLNRVIWERLELPETLFRQWVPVEVAVPSVFAGSDVRVRFVFDSLDGGGNTGQGAFFDDIVLKTACP